jgi:hypothetical protein
LNFFWKHSSSRHRAIALRILQRLLPTAQPENAALRADDDRAYLVARLRRI